MKINLNNKTEEIVYTREKPINIKLVEEYIFEHDYIHKIKT